MFALNDGVASDPATPSHFAGHGKLRKPFDAIASTIQSAVTSVFLFAGIGGIVNVIGMRLRRSVDRARPIETLHTEPNGVDRHRYLNKLAMHQRRIKHSNRATTLSGASALAVGLVVVLLFLSQILGFNLGTAVALVLVVAMILLARALIGFLAEIHIAIGGRRVHQEHRRRPGV